MLPVNYRVDQLKLHLMFNINHRMAPSYLFCPRVRDQHSIGTRSREYDVVVPRVRGPGSSTFAFTAANLWNDLPDNIQSIDTPGSFRRAVYMFLVRNYEAYDANPFLYGKHLVFLLYIILLYLFIYWITVYCTYNPCHLLVFVNM